MNDLEKRFVVRTTKRMKAFRLSRIMYMEADGAYTDLFDKEGTKHTLTRHLGHYWKQLMEYGCFVRISRKHVVNIRYVDGFASPGMVYLTNETELPATDSLLKKLKEMLKSL